MTTSTADELYGDFEDLETEDVGTANSEDSSDEGEHKEETDDVDIRLQKKKKLKASFDAEYPPNNIFNFLLIPLCYNFDKNYDNDP